jgi:hypothetical protein
MPKVLTRDERRERTRTGLIDAAERLFVRTGFHATSVDAVAAVAGYTKGAVYSTQRLAERLAGLGVRDPRVEVEPVEQLERSAGGKLQVVVAEREVRSP